MARLQDFQSVTPTSSDNLLIVQAQGQGLATVENVRQKMAGDTNIGDLGDILLTSAQAGQGLQFASIGGVLKLVNTSRNIIKHIQVKGTTDSTGDLLISSLPLASYQILSAYKNRSVSGEGVIGYCILGGNNIVNPYIHVIKSDNTNLANTAVTLEIFYVEI